MDTFPNTSGVLRLFAGHLHRPQGRNLSQTSHDPCLFPHTHACTRAHTQATLVYLDVRERERAKESARERERERERERGRVGDIAWWGMMLAVDAGNGIGTDMMAGMYIYNIHIYIYIYILCIYV